MEIDMVVLTFMKKCVIFKSCSRAPFFVNEHGYINFNKKRSSQ